MQSGNGRCADAGALTTGFVPVRRTDVGSLWASLAPFAIAAALMPINW